MRDVENLAQIKQYIQNEPMVLTYISRPSCGVCTALKPKVVELLEDYPLSTSYYVNLDTIPEAAGEFSVFTLPGIVVFVDGKESVREARYVSVPELFKRIDRLYNLRFDIQVATT